jgi:thioredoxin 1
MGPPLQSLVVFVSEVIELHADEWDDEVKNVEGPVVVDFWHPMCGWCQKLTPEYEKLPPHFENVKFAKMNILDNVDNRKIAIESGVMGTPTIKVFCNGRSIGEIVGFRPLKRLVNELNTIFEKRDDCLDQSTPLE